MRAQTPDPTELVLYNGVVLTPRQRFTGGLVIRGGLISRLFEGEPPAKVEKPAAGFVDARGCWIIPGFIDLHLHGGAGVDFNDAGIAEIEKALVYHASAGGTTALVPTLLTDSPARLEKAVQMIRRARCAIPAPEILGLHLEGPFLNPEFRGAHPEAHLRLPQAILVEKLCTLAGEDLSILTLAPELPGGMAAVAYLKEQGVIAALGHSGASYETVAAASAAGLSYAVHTFSAMAGFHHRAPGTTGAVLDIDSVTAELIADGVHTHPAAARLLWRCKGSGGVVLVTDASPATGLSEGRYTLGGQELFIETGISRLADGTLAGSTLTMNQAVAGAVKMVSLSLADAVAAASLNPARILKLDRRKGTLEPGKDADVVVMDSSYTIRLTVCRGRIVYNGF